jgi:predicted Mrr-cat superfamily restriction endonuclease
MVAPNSANRISLIEIVRAEVGNHRRGKTDWHELKVINSKILKFKSELESETFMY